MYSTAAVLKRDSRPAREFQLRFIPDFSSENALAGLDKVSFIMDRITPLTF